MSSPSDSEDLPGPHDHEFEGNHAEDENLIMEVDQLALEQDIEAETTTEPKDQSSFGVDKRFDDALDSAGLGVFHVILTLVCGLAVVADSTEVICVSYIIPVAEGELQLDGVDKGLLNSTTFVGMFLGSIFWGSLADFIGRKRGLIMALLVNGGAAFLSAFMPNFASFAVLRFLSGLGVGGSIPIAFAYSSEFFSAKRKGPFVILLELTWTFMVSYASLLAWVLLSNPCLIDTHLGSMPFRTWRVYVMFCTVPAFLSAVLFIFMPESPSWLYNAGHLMKAKSVIETVSRINRMSSICCKAGLCRSKVVFDWQEFGETNEDPAHFKSDSVHTSLSSEIPSQDLTTSPERANLKDSTSKNHAGLTILGKFKKAFSNMRKLFSKQYIRTTMSLLATVSLLSFGFYGLLIWLPVYFNNLLKNETVNGTTGGCSVVGSNCTQLDSSCSEIYLDGLLVSASGIPGTILGILTINIVGGRAQTTSSMLLAALSVFFIWWLPAAKNTVLILTCVFSGITAVGWGGFDVLQVSYFETDVRATATGLLNAAARPAIIIANLLFGVLQSVNPGIPILIVSVCLFAGGTAPLFLPLSDYTDHRSLLGKLCMNWKEALCRRVKRIRRGTRTYALFHNVQQDAYGDANSSRSGLVQDDEF